MCGGVVTFGLRYSLEFCALRAFDFHEIFFVHNVVKVSHK